MDIIRDDYAYLNALSYELSLLDEENKGETGLAKQFRELVSQAVGIARIKQDLIFQHENIQNVLSDLEKLISENYENILSRQKEEKEREERLSLIHI